MKIKVEESNINDDGSVDMVFTMDVEALNTLAKIGLRKCLEEAAEKLEAAAKDYGHFDTEGAGDAPAGEDGDPPVHGEFPGF